MFEAPATPGINVNQGFNIQKLSKIISFSGRSGAFNFRHYAAATQDTLAGFSIDATQVPC